MELAIGFVIAFAIAVTGVGAGTITAPLLILFLHVPIELSVGTALAYSAIVKMIVVPVQIWRKQVVYRVVGWMLLGGLPGVILGVVLFHRVVRHGEQNLLYVALGSIIVASSAWHLYRNLRPRTATDGKKGAPRMDCGADAADWYGGGLLILGRWRFGHACLAQPHLARCIAGRRHGSCLRALPVAGRWRHARF